MNQVSLIFMLLFFKFEIKYKFFMIQVENSNEIIAEETIEKPFEFREEVSELPKSSKKLIIEELNEDKEDEIIEVNIKRDSGIKSSIFSVNNITNDKGKRI